MLEKPNFAIALSQEPLELAVKEISLKIKSFVVKTARPILLYYTPHYPTNKLIELIKHLLNPSILVTLETPYLIFEDKIIEKGLMVSCIDKEQAKLNSILIKQDKLKDSEINTIKNYLTKGEFLSLFLAQDFNPINYLNKILSPHLSPYPILGGGFSKRWSKQNYNITDSSAELGSLNLIGNQLFRHNLSFNGFSPFGEKFTITKAIEAQSLIMEINGKPAIEIYREYFQDKFPLFKENNLFALYPIEITQGEKKYLITVANVFEDGSLLCLGKVQANTQGNFLTFRRKILLDNLNQAISPIKNYGQGLVFIINSLPRKNLLKDVAQEEIAWIKNTLGENFLVIGVYCDYTIFSQKDTSDFSLESGNLLLTLWG